MPTWLMRVAVGCATTIMSFLAMVLLFILALYLACGDCEPEYNSSASSYFILVPAAPLFLLASIILGAVVGCRSAGRGGRQRSPPRAWFVPC